MTWRRRGGKERKGANAVTPAGSQHSPLELVVRPDDGLPQSILVREYGIAHLRTPRHRDAANGQPRLIVAAELPDEDAVFLPPRTGDLVVFGRLRFAIDGTARFLARFGGW